MGRRKTVQACLQFVQLICCDGESGYGKQTMGDEAIRMHGWRKHFVIKQPERLVLLFINGERY